MLLVEEKISGRIAQKEKKKRATTILQFIKVPILTVVHVRCTAFVFKLLPVSLQLLMVIKSNLGTLTNSE